VNLSRIILRGTSLEISGFAVVNADMVERACVDLEALVLQVLRTGRINSPMRVQISVASESKLPLRCATHDFAGYKLDESAPPLPRLRPVTVEIPTTATEEDTKAAAAELAGSVLNQFGLVCHLARYRY
jgi:hypothetical protein